ncbi:MAG: PspC domain-containing protein [Chlamydiota bacterium]|jgi:phage shock protein PspC (stress-responsive transcriptional regulator)
MKKLYRSKKNKMIAGICAGLGDYFRIDPFIFRFALIFLCIFTGIVPLLVAYLLGCFIIPSQPASYTVKKYKKLYRSRKNRKIAGICGGISEFFKWDSSLVRIIFVALFFITGFLPMFLTYIIGWIIIPEKPGKEENIEIEIS